MERERGRGREKGGSKKSESRERKEEGMKGGRGRKKDNLSRDW